MKAMKTIAILGATGAVGREMLKILEERDFPAGRVKLLASARSAGTAIPFRGGTLTVETAEESAFQGVDIVLGAAESDITRIFAPAIQAAGAVLIDNSSAFRLESHVPLVVPEINPNDAFTHQGIIASPNCSTIITLTGIWPIVRSWGLKNLVASTYQAVSGAGVRGPAQLEAELRGEPCDPVFAHPIAMNIIPCIGDGEGYTSEELKLQNEGRKILHLPDLQVSCTCARVPVLRCHSISASLETQLPVTPQAAREAIAKGQGVGLMDDAQAGIYPMPINTGDQDTVFVGRIRTDPTRPNGLALWCCGDQLRKGAATNAVQIAQLIIGG